MPTIEGKVVVITGASSGIGEATARLLAQHGAHVVMGARRLERLEALATDIRSKGGTVSYQQLDVTNRESMEAFLQYAQTTYGRVDVLVNDAGVMPLSNLEALKVDEWNQMIDVNLRGVLHGIAAALPLFQKQGSGHFVNIGSLGSYTVQRTAAVYAATKFAVRALTDGLRQEVGNDIRVTLIAPGVVQSELAESITDDNARKFMDQYRQIALPGEAIGQAILFAIEQPVEVDVSEMIVRPSRKS